MGKKKSIEITKPQKSAKSKTKSVIVKNKIAKKLVSSKSKISAKIKASKAIDALLIKNKTPTIKIKNQKKEDETIIEEVVDDKIEDISINNIHGKFKISEVTIKSAIKGVLKLTNENPKLKNQLFDEEFPIFLQFNAIKIPKTRPKLIRIGLAHSFHKTSGEICLIVPDVKGVKNNEHEKHLEVYEELLNRKGVTGIAKIMTFHELRTEYETFELRRGLVGLYDAFLVDGRISGKVVQKLGKIFYDARKVPIPVKLQVTNLKGQIDDALKKSVFQLHSNGDSFMVQVGRNGMDESEIVENVYAALEGLEKQFPGGIGNIRTISLKCPRCTSIPIYKTLKNPNTVEVPKLIKQKRKGWKKVKGEMSTEVDKDVIVWPSGKIILKKNKKSEVYDE